MGHKRKIMIMMKEENVEDKVTHHHLRGIEKGVTVGLATEGIINLHQKLFQNLCQNLLHNLCHDLCHLKKKYRSGSKLYSPGFKKEPIDKVKVSPLLAKKTKRVIEGSIKSKTNRGVGPLRSLKKGENNQDTTSKVIHDLQKGNLTMMLKNAVNNQDHQKGVDIREVRKSNQNHLKKIDTTREGNHDLQEVQFTLKLKEGENNQYHLTRIETTRNIGHNLQKVLMTTVGMKYPLRCQ